jgi:hypothetical protein
VPEDGGPVSGDRLTELDAIAHRRPALAGEQPEHLTATAPSEDAPYQPRHKKRSDCGGNRQFVESRHDKPSRARI